MIGYQQFVHHDVYCKIPVRVIVDLSLRNRSRQSRPPLRISQLSREEISEPIPLLKKSSEIEVGVLLLPPTSLPSFWAKLLSLRQCSAMPTPPITRRVTSEFFDLLTMRLASSVKTSVGMTPFHSGRSFL